MTKALCLCQDDSKAIQVQGGPTPTSSEGTLQSPGLHQHWGLKKRSLWTQGSTQENI